MLGHAWPRPQARHGRCGAERGTLLDGRKSGLKGRTGAVARIKNTHHIKTCVGRETGTPKGSTNEGQQEKRKKKLTALRVDVAFGSRSVSVEAREGRRLVVVREGVGGGARLLEVRRPGHGQVHPLRVDAVALGDRGGLVRLSLNVVVVSRCERREGNRGHGWHHADGTRRNDVAGSERTTAEKLNWIYYMGDSESLMVVK